MRKCFCKYLFLSVLTALRTGLLAFLPAGREWAGATTANLPPLRPSLSSELEGRRSAGACTGRAWGRCFSMVLLLVIFPISKPIRVEIPPLPLRPAGTFYSTRMRRFVLSRPCWLLLFIVCSLAVGENASMTSGLRIARWLSLDWNWITVRLLIGSQECVLF
jgi:hypothetical protein